jgi:tRNA(fMet)-specific endonuclease VapC
MRYLLDTNVLSDFVRGDPKVLARVQVTAPSLIAVSVVTVMELEYGLLLNRERAKKLAPIIDAFLNSITVLDLSRADALAAASLRANLRQRGRPIGPFDILLAGSAVSRGLILVTSNTREFERITGLQIEDWRV